MVTKEHQGVKEIWKAQGLRSPTAYAIRYAHPRQKNETWPFALADSTKIRGCGFKPFLSQQQRSHDRSLWNQPMILEREKVESLRGHMSRRSEKNTPALLPDQEEAKAKHWWQLWKKR